jgi:CRISPR/Cas system CSM-associated protein Csm4 (group 5 of RAMP superfamily)
MQDSLLDLDFKSSISNLDSIKIMRAVVRAYASIYSPNEIISIVKKGGFIASEPILKLENRLLVENKVIPLNFKGKYRDKMKERKKKKYIDIGNINELEKLLKNSNYSTLKIEDDDDYSKYENIFKELPSYISDEVPDIRPGINISQNNFFVREQDLKVHNTYSILVKYSDQKILYSLNAAMEMGISARRSTGAGYIKVKKISQFSGGKFSREGLYLLLSPFIPNNEDYGNIDFPKSYYRINSFSGRQSNGTSYNIYKYIEPGSFLYLKGEPTGSVIEEREQIFIFKGLFVR